MNTKSTTTILIITLLAALNLSMRNSPLVAEATPPVAIILPNPQKPAKKTCESKAYNVIKNLEAQCFGGLTKSDGCPYWWARAKCWALGDAEAKKWSKTCGKDIMMMRTKDMGPSDCYGEKCVEHANTLIEKKRAKCQKDAEKLMYSC